MSYPQETFPSITLLPTTLLSSRRAAVLTHTLPYQLSILKSTGRYSAFNLQWQPIYSDPPDTPPIPKHLFWDSDVAKWLEGACYLLHTLPPAARPTEITEAISHLVSLIGTAQQADGYLNIHYTVVAPGMRFTNLRDMHELYNAGHLIEAALAHDLYLGCPRPIATQSPLLATMVRYADLLCRTFGDGEGKSKGYPGHPEVELALLRLGERTGEARYKELAGWFVRERGNAGGCWGRHFYEVEAERRGAKVKIGFGACPGGGPESGDKGEGWWYMQAHQPVVEQMGVEGHSVRAMYLLTAAADLCLVEKRGEGRGELVNGDGGGKGELVNGAGIGKGKGEIRQLETAVRRLWDDMVARKMYVTGGIGAIKAYEGFGMPYFLPQSKEEGGCYAETCAGIGVMMFAERLLKLRLDGGVGDVLELALYNAVLTGMSSDGKKFTYWNPLGSGEGALAEREEWFVCACCPPNVLRLLGGIGGYIYSVGQKAIDVHLFVASVGKWTVHGDEVSVKQESDYPWSGEVKFTVESKSEQVGLNVRIPKWAEEGWTISPAPEGSKVEAGYLRLPASYLLANPSFTLSLPMAPRYISTHPYASHQAIFVARGPTIYCVEDVDNTFKGGAEDHFRSLMIDPKTPIEEKAVEDQETGERYVKLTLRDGAALFDSKRADEAWKHGNVDLKESEELLKAGGGETPVQELVFVPFFFRANRKASKGVSRTGLMRWKR